MNKFYMNGKLIHKASDHNTKRCEIEKWVFLPHSDFERLKVNPYGDEYVSKVEITIPPQFSEAIEKAAEKEEITADELTERAMKKLLERSSEDVGNSPISRYLSTKVRSAELLRCIRAMRKKTVE